MNKTIEEIQSENTANFLVSVWILTVSCGFSLGLEPHKFKRLIDFVWELSFICSFLIWISGSMAYLFTMKYAPEICMPDFGRFQIFMMIFRLMLVGFVFERHYAQAVYMVIFGLMALMECLGPCSAYIVHKLDMNFLDKTK